MPVSDIEQNPDQSTILDVALAAALAAGEEILGVYSRDFSVEIKPDSSPLTEADILAEALILDRLGAAFPAIPVIAEEAFANGCAPKCDARFFLVDPLDGSKEFIAKNGEFTVNIALIEHAVPVLGVIYAPALGRIWWAGSTVGAWTGRVEAGRIVSRNEISVRQAPETGIRVVGSRSHRAGEDGNRLTSFAVSDFASMGSSLKFCILAEGGADLYPRFGRTMEWDTAAGDAILRAAGGKVLDIHGEDFCYGKCNQSGDSDFANGPFWALGDPSLISAIRNRKG